MTPRHLFGTDLEDWDKGRVLRAFGLDGRALFIISCMAAPGITTALLACCETVRFHMGDAGIGVSARRRWRYQDLRSLPFVVTGVYVSCIPPQAAAYIAPGIPPSGARLLPSPPLSAHPPVL